MNVEKEQLTIDQLVANIKEGNYEKAYVVILGKDGVMSEYQFSRAFPETSRD